MDQPTSSKTSSTPEGKPQARMWGGRFRRPADPEFERLNASLPVDGRLLDEDLTVNAAWAEALGRAGVLFPEEVRSLLEALQQIRAEWCGRDLSREPAEDVHSFVEAQLVERLGELGYKIHTGRSRNDQVATDMRLHILKRIPALQSRLAEAVAALLSLARRQMAVPMPGYTHLQRAQPLLFAHYLLSYERMLDRDCGRLEAVRVAADEMPLGSGALAGTAYPIDRRRLAESLGFSRVSRNSLDAVSDRDFLCDFLYAAAVLMGHLSRLSTDFILFSGSEFGFLQLGDTITTGSSLMPQKRNPDALELIRAKASLMEGRLMTLLGILRGLPTGYNKDLQEDKPAVFAALDELSLVLAVIRQVLADTEIREEAMRRAADDAFLLATDVADYLVQKGMPFRKAHAVIGEWVTRALEEERSLRDWSVEELPSIHPLFGPDIAAWLNLDSSLARRQAIGGTAPLRVAEELEAAERLWHSRIIQPRITGSPKGETT